MLEDALTVGPQHERTLFCNRDKFDLVVLYDNSSETFGSPKTPLSVLFAAIYENSFRKILKKMPMLIVGGLEAWKKDLGEDEIVHGETSATGSESHRVTTAHNTSHASAGSFGPVTPDPHKLWVPPHKGEVSSAASEESPRISVDQASGSSRFACLCAPIFQSSDIHHCLGTRIIRI
jgi:hypothetical protein